MSFFPWCARFVPLNFQPFFGLPIKWWHMPWEFIMERYFGIPIHLGEMGQVFIPPKWWKHPKPAAILKMCLRSEFAPPMTFIYQNNFWIQCEIFVRYVYSARKVVLHFCNFQQYSLHFALKVETIIKKYIFWKNNWIMDLITKNPGLQHVAENIYHFNLLKCQNVNTEWKKILESPYFK